MHFACAVFRCLLVDPINDVSFICMEQRKEINKREGRKGEMMGKGRWLENDGETEERRRKKKRMQK